MYNFTYQIPTRIHFGKGQISHLTELAESGDSVLLVYGGGSIKKAGIYDEALKLLEEADLEVFELSGVEPNPRIESVRKGVELCKVNDIDMVLAIGGGSVIDCAKVIAAGACYDGDPWDLVLDSNRISTALPVFSVLTLAATGSEMDSFAVISDMSQNIKKGTGSLLMVPEMSVLDPTYTFTVSQYQTSAGTADIMSHTIENYFTTVEGYLQARFAEAVLKTCIHFGPIAYNDPENYEARANLMWAGSWAINGTLNGGCGVGWSAHPMEHELSAFYDITHGVGLALLTPHWMEHILSEDTVDKFAEYGVNVWDIDKTKDKWDIAKEAIACTSRFFKEEMHIPMTMREAGIPDKENFEIMAEKAAAGCKYSYVPLTKEDVLAIFEAAF